MAREREKGLQYTYNTKFQFSWQPSAVSEKTSNEKIRIGTLCSFGNIRRRKQELGTKQAAEAQNAKRWIQKEKGGHKTEFTLQASPTNARKSQKHGDKPPKTSKKAALAATKPSACGISYIIGRTTEQHSPLELEQNSCLLATVLCAQNHRLSRHNSKITCWLRMRKRWMKMAPPCLHPHQQLQKDRLLLTPNAR